MRLRSLTSCRCRTLAPRVLTCWLAGGGTSIDSRFALGLICVVGSLVAEAAMLNIQEFYLFAKYGVSTVNSKPQQHWT